MKIGLVVPGFSAHASDWCIPALRHFVQRLAQVDHVRVLAIRYPYNSGRYRLCGAHVIALGGGLAQGASSLNVWRHVLATLASEHRRLPFDLLHAFWATESGALTAIAGRMLGVPAVVSLAGGELVGLRDIGYGGQLAFSERQKIRVALRLAHRVTAGSHYLLALARQRARSGAAAPLFLRMPLGVDLDLFSPDRPSAVDDPPRLLHVASLTPIKDQVTLLHAVAQLQARRVACTLDIAGAGVLEPQLRALAQQLGVARQVCFRGAVEHDALPEIYRRSALFVLSSRHEAQCMAVLEAAACGLPTVGTAVGVVPELAPAAATAVPVGDAEALADAIAAMLANDARRQAMSAVAARAAQAFGVEQCVDRARGVYAEVSR